MQDRVRKEVDSVVQESHGKLTIKSLQNLPYLERCIKESLRLYPSVPLISRVTSEDVKLSSYLVPARTCFLLPIYAIHRDLNFWPNSEVVDPDRFLPEKIQNRHPYSYLVLDHVTASQIVGQRFALLEMKAMVAPLVHNFYLEPIDYLKNLRLQTDLVLRPANSLRVKFVPVSKMNAST